MKVSFRDEMGTSQNIHAHAGPTSPGGRSVLKGKSGCAARRETRVEEPFYYVDFVLRLNLHILFRGFDISLEALPQLRWADRGRPLAHGARRCRCSIGVLPMEWAIKPISFPAPQKFLQLTPKLLKSREVMMPVGLTPEGGTVNL